MTMIEQHLGTLVTTTPDDDVQGYMMDLGAVATIRQREMLHEAGVRVPVAVPAAGVAK